MTVAIRAIAMLSVCAAAVALFCWQTLDERAVQFMHDDTGGAFRAQLAATMALAAVVTAAAGAGYLTAKGPRAAAKLRRLARLSAPLPLIVFLPALSVPGAWDSLATVIAIALFVFLFERLLRVSLDELQGVEGGALSVPRPTGSRRWIATAAVCGGAAFYAFYMSKYTVYSHRRFGTYGYDLAQYDNVFWSTLNGHPMRCAPLGLVSDWQDIGNHADLSVFFLLPFYAIRPNAETLLVIQACILGLGAIPLYLFAARRLPPSHAAALACAYLLFPPLHGSNFYDFHFQPVAATFVLCTIYCLDAKRWILAGIAFVVALGCREDTSIGLAMLGAYCIYSGYRPRAGAVMAVVATLYFVVIKFVIMPRYWSTWFADIYKDLYPQPDGSRSFGGIIQTLLVNPSYVFKTLLASDKLRYFLQVMTPIAFLPLRRWYLLPALAPGTLFTLLTTGYEPTIDIGFQYSGQFTAYIFTASAVMLASYRSEPLARVKMPAALAALAAGTLLCTAQWGAFPPRGIKGGFVNVGFQKPSEAHEQKARDLAELFAMIPEEATYAVSEQEMPHVSGRLTVRSLRHDTGDADFLLYGPGSIGAEFGVRALDKGEYVEVARRTGLMLLKRKQ